MAYQPKLCIATFIQMLNRDGVPIAGRAYQNHLDEVRSWEGVDYEFGPFAIEGDQVSGGGESRSILAAGSNMLTQAICAEACLNRWLLEVKLVVQSCTETATFPVWTELNTVATDIWLCANYRAARTDSSVQIELLSPGSAVEAYTPNCILQQYQVGSLPVTGNIIVG